MTWKGILELRRAWSKYHDAYLLYKPEAWRGADLRYITGFTGSTAFFLQSRRRNLLIVDFRYKIQARKEVKEGVEVLDVPPGKSPLSSVAEKLKSLKVKSVAVEGNIPAVVLKNLRKALRGSGVRLYVVSGYISNLRVKKENQEIELIREAQRLTDSLFSWILDNVEPGKMTEKELAFEMEIWARRNGAEGMAFESIVASGPNSALPHARPTDKVIPESGVLLLDFGLRVNGYVSDMTRTLWIGKQVDEEFKRAYEVVLEAQRRAIEKLHFGKWIRAKEVDRAAREVIENSDFAGTFGHGLGHGVGMDVHEAPTLSPLSKYILKGDEVVTVEPGVYLEGKFGVRIEDIVVAKRGENLTSSPKSLILI
ncbi:MAG: aminopeptidase P family protein [Thermotogae bacterium]|nr:aminopeptidase P family protein [Thermotogota bacterium]